MTALDIGANNLVACTTTTGEQYLYELTFETQISQEHDFCHAGF